MRKFGWIFVLVALIFGQLLTVGPIKWDDDSNIFINPYYRAGIWSQVWLKDYFGLYVPVTSSVWQILYALGGAAPWPYRVLNLVLHLINTGLVLILLQWLAKKWDVKSHWPALLALSFFALHPLQIQAVAWISGGRDLLSAFFGLSAVLVFFGLRDFRGAIASTILVTAAVLSKPNIVVLPALLPFVTGLLLPKFFRRSLWLAGVWLIPSVFSIYKTLQAQAEFLIPLKLWERLLIMGDTYSFYLQKIVIPYPLSANYSRTPESVLETLDPYWRTAIVLVLFVPAMIWAWRRDWRFFLALAWLALLLPVSGISSFGYQKISTTADHYHYLPMTMVSVMALLILARWPVKASHLKVGTLMIVAALFVRSMVHVQTWKSNEAFFKNMAIVAPDSYSTALGMTVVECEDNKRYDEGIRWAGLALERKPKDILALANLAYCYLHAKDYISVTKLESYLDQLDLVVMEAKQPTAYSSFLASIGAGFFELGQLERGFPFLCEAFRIMPSDANHKRNLDIAHRIMTANRLNTTCPPKLRE